MGSFILFDEWERHFLRLDMGQRGALITALFAYHKRQEEPDVSDPAVDMAFSFIQAAMDENDRRYEQTQAARSKAGRSGGLAKASKAGKANVCQNDAGKAALSVSVSVSESESESESVPPAEGDKKRAGKPRFTPPTVAEVADYVTERNSPVAPQEFVDFYAAKGWMVGKTPMKDWKAACRNAEKWERWALTTASERPSRPTARASFSEIAAKMEREGKL